MESPVVERLDEGELHRIKPLLVELYLGEQPHFADHPQLSREQLEEQVDEISPRFGGENVVFAARTAGGELAGFCWCVLFDPGTGLEGEVAEVYVSPSHRGLRVGEALLERAVGLFRERGVTLAYVWTREENEPAVRLYRGAGFQPSRQLVLTWYPSDS